MKIQLIKETKTGKTFLVDGVEFNVNIYGKIMWASDWGKILEMVDNGLLRSKTYKNLWAHTDIFVDDTQVENATQAPAEAPQVIETGRNVHLGAHIPDGTTISGIFSIDGSDDLLFLDNADVYFTDETNVYLFPSVFADESGQLCVEALVIS